MTDEGKKISFGFAKSIKKPALKIQPPKEKKTVDYIECIDEKAIKVVGGEAKEEEPLVIPLLGSKTWHDRIVNKTDADIFENKIKKENGIDVKTEKNSIAVNNSEVTLKDVSHIKKEKLEEDENVHKTSDESSINNSKVTPMDVSEIKKEKPDEIDNVPKSLDEQAASEIIQDLQSNDTKVEHSNFTLPVTENGNLQGEREATLEDYEKIPIEAFGLAMLRGMGWKPDEGIGKNSKIVSAAIPELRPKGMGLGADKVTLQKQMQKQMGSKTKEEEQLKMEKGSFVRIIGGKFANYYGQIEGFDDEAGTSIVKMALSGQSRSFPECLIQPVTKAEYTKNSKVLNVGKYEEYSQKGRSKNHAEETVESNSSEEEVKTRREDRDRDPKISKKSKKRSKYSSDESTDSERKSKKRRNSSNSEDDYRHKKSKKSKKSHKRDSSSDRSRKKNKKRDRDSDKTRERRREDSSDRKKHKKHKRSRSRSPTRR